MGRWATDHRAFQGCQALEFGGYSSRSSAWFCVCPPWLPYRVSVCRAKCSLHTEHGSHVFTGGLAGFSQQLGQDVVPQIHASLAGHHQGCVITHWLYTAWRVESIANWAGYHSTSRGTSSLCKTSSSNGSHASEFALVPKTLHNHGCSPPGASLLCLEQRNGPTEGGGAKGPWEPSSPRGVPEPRGTGACPASLLPPCPLSAPPTFLKPKPLTIVQIASCENGLELLNIQEVVIKINVL